MWGLMTLLPLHCGCREKILTSWLVVWIKKDFYVDWKALYLFSIKPLEKYVILSFNVIIFLDPVIPTLYLFVGIILQGNIK